MRYAVPLVSIALAACGGSATKTPPFEGHDGGATLTYAGREPDMPSVTAGQGGAVSVTAGSPSGGLPAVAGSSVTVGGAAIGGVGGVMSQAGTAGQPSGGGGAGGAPQAGEPAVGGAPEAGQGGEVTVVAGAGGAASEPPLPWKVCQDGQVCADDEVCVYDTDSTRICTPIDDFVHRCVPAPAPTIIQEACDKLRPECRYTWRLCNMMSIDAEGTDCGSIMFYPATGGERWNCGPPN